MTRDARPERIELAEEQVEITKREVERGRVVVRTRVGDTGRDRRDRAAAGGGDGRSCPLGVPVEVAPAVREEDGVLIVPVLEEQLVLTTRLILKEEIRITRRSRTEVVREPVQLRSEQADILRLEGRDAADLPDPDQRSPVHDGTNPDGDV